MGLPKPGAVTVFALWNKLVRWSVLPPTKHFDYHNRAVRYDPRCRLRGDIHRLEKATRTIHAMSPRFYNHLTISPSALSTSRLYSKLKMWLIQSFFYDLSLLFDYIYIIFFYAWLTYLFILLLLLLYWGHSVMKKIWLWLLWHLLPWSSLLHIGFQGLPISKVQDSIHCRVKIEILTFLSCIWFGCLWYAVVSDFHCKSALVT